MSLTRALLTAALFDDGVDAIVARADAGRLLYTPAGKALVAIVEAALVVRELDQETFHDDDCCDLCRAIRAAEALTAPASVAVEPDPASCPRCLHSWSLHGPPDGCRSDVMTCGCAPVSGCDCPSVAVEP